MTARTVPLPAVWGVGRVGSTAWPVSPADLADETASAVEHLQRLGVGSGGLLLIVSRLAESIHVAPLEQAAGVLEARWSSADATAGDAFRTASLVRQLSPDAVVGVNGTIVQALDDPAAVFASVPVVAVTDDLAHRTIPHARWWLRLGPTSAFECEARTGAHVDGSRWRVATRDGEITITNLVPRLTTAIDLPTGVRGAVVHDPCPCGSNSPRVVVA